MTRKRLSLRFDTRDVWVGVYRDIERRRLYICPLPCVVIMVQLRACSAAPDAADVAATEPAVTS